MTGKDLTESRQNIYIALEELNFIWDEKQVSDIDYLWKEGRSVEDIARYIKRPVDEVFLLLYDRALKDKVKNRPGGLLGEH